jgi:hypothetical protein
MVLSRVVTLYILYSGGDGFESHPETNYHDWGFRSFSQFLKENTEVVYQLGHDRFHLNLSQIIVHQSSYHKGKIVPK